MQAQLDGKTLTLVIPLEAPRPSSTGKMLIHFTSGGFSQVHSYGLRVNLTVAEYPKR